MSIGLDLGLSHVRSLRRRRYRLIGRSCRSTFVTLKDSPICRQVLRFLGAPFAVWNRRLIVLGDRSVDVAELFEKPLSPLFRAHPARHDDAPIRRSLAVLIDALVPSPPQPGAFCCLSMPGIDAGAGSDEEVEFFQRLIELRGYRPLWISAASAIVLAELVGESFTGVGMSLGAGSCAIGLVRQGVEIAKCTVPLGGNWLDEQLALRNDGYLWDATGDRFLDTESARQWKEALSGSLLEPAGPREREAAELYRELIADVLSNAAAALSDEPSVAAMSEPLTLVCAGGTAAAPGFRELLLEGLETTPLPVRINDVRVVAKWQYTIARGCLIQAELRSQEISSERAA